MELARKGREVIRSGPVSLPGDTEEEGIKGFRDIPWEVNNSNHILSTSALGSDIEKMSPLNWFENWWD